MKRAWILILILSWIGFSSSLQGQESEQNFYFRGSFHLDWFGAKYQDTDFFNQFSARLKMEMINRLGQGWTLNLDLRDRFRPGEAGNNQALLYNARLTFDRPQTRLFFSLGQMNLYGTAGIGQLLGGMAGYKIHSDWLLGVYAGLESSIYINRVEGDYRKFGFFGRYLGANGIRLGDQVTAEPSLRWVGALSSA